MDRENYISSLKILNVGCGNSILPEQMYDLGYRDIHNVDISAPCIETIKNRNIEVRPELTWKVMSCLDMSEYESNQFDIVIDKSTIDCLVCAKRAYKKVACMLKES